jgi:invasion protein IalB
MRQHERIAAVFYRKVIRLRIPHLPQVAAAAAVALATLTIPALTQEAGSTLPGGASSLQETYQDWSLGCQGTPTVACAISQQQTQQNGQRILAVELRKGEDDAVAGNLVLPFGLLLETGATLQIDDEPQREPLKFSTCLPAGCLVPVSFDTSTVAELRTGTALRVKVQGMDRKEVVLSISLKGLAPALDRLKTVGANP